MNMFNIRQLFFMIIMGICFCSSVTHAVIYHESVSRMVLESSAFVHGQDIPREYTCDGDNASPPLNWSKVPDGAKSFVIICDDPDAPDPEMPREEPWVHWVVFNIPSQINSLSKDRPPRGVRVWEYGIKQGSNDFRKNNIGYSGPCPPRSTRLGGGAKSHRYFFRVYALDIILNVQPGATKAQVLTAMEGHLVGYGQLMGIYQRKL